MPSNYKIAGIVWVVVQEGRDMHVLPVFEGTEEAMPGHTLSASCACGVAIEPNAKHKNLVYTHEIMN